MATQSSGPGKYTTTMKSTCIALSMISLPPLLRAAADSAEQEPIGLKSEAVSQKSSVPKSGTPGNDPARCEWFEDQALGMFIHWSVDCPLGSVISHHLVGSTKDYKDKFFTTMPDFFYPQDFRPDDWARLAK